MAINLFRDKDPQLHLECGVLMHKRPGSAGRVLHSQILSEKMDRFDHKDEIYGSDEFPGSRTADDVDKPNVAPRAVDVFADNEGQQIQYKTLSWQVRAEYVYVLP
jgi:hypothetical protein